MPKNLITSDASIKRIKPADSIRRLSDGDGLYLLLAVKGGSHCWRFDYTIDAVRKTFSLGTYPATTLSHARRLAEDARRMVREGVDPSLARKTARGVSVRTKVNASRGQLREIGPGSLKFRERVPT
jgi:hypothetical protein